LHWARSASISAGDQVSGGGEPGAGVCGSTAGHEPCGVGAVTRGCPATNTGGRDPLPEPCADARSAVTDGSASAAPKAQQIDERRIMDADGSPEVPARPRPHSTSADESLAKVSS